jgi:hypothetical protein
MESKFQTCAWLELAYAWSDKNHLTLFGTFGKIAQPLAFPYLFRLLYNKWATFWFCYMIHEFLSLFVHSQYSYSLVPNDIPI